MTVVIPHRVAAAGDVAQTTAIVTVGRGRFAVAVGRAKESVDSRGENLPKAVGVLEVAAPRVLQTVAAVLVVRGDGQKLGPNLILLHKGRQEADGAEGTAGGFGTVVNVAGLTDHRARRGQRVVRVVIVLDGKSELLEVVRALHAARGLASGLNGGKKQTDQDTDDRDNNEQLNKGETSLKSAFHGMIPSNVAERFRAP